MIFLGYPDWWDAYPQAVKVFLTQYDFSGKTIIPFCTHEGSEFGNSLDNLKKMCPKSHIQEGLAIQGKAAHNSDGRIEEWLKKIKDYQINPDYGNRTFRIVEIQLLRYIFQLLFQ